MSRAALLQELGLPKPNPERIEQLVIALEASLPCSLEQQQHQLDAVWELRWSSSRQPYLQVQPWLENLQVLQPSQGRGMNLLRLKGPLAGLGSVAVVAELSIAPPQRVGVRFRRGGWMGPSLGPWRARLLSAVNQAFPAWLDITVLTDELRICRGNNGTLFVLTRRADLHPEQLFP